MMILNLFILYCFLVGKSNIFFIKLRLFLNFIYLCNGVGAIA